MTGAFLLLLAAGLFSALGQWQLQRGQEQSALEAEASASRQLPSLDLRSASVSGRDAYRHAEAEGIYDGSQQFYLEGRRFEGRTGYHVLTPMRITGTRRYVLVNRGWIPMGSATAEIPPGRVRVSGILVPPQLPFLRLGRPEGATRPFLDPRDYARESGREVEPLVLVSDTTSAFGLVPVKVEQVSKSGMHLGYALQWFAFACIAFVVSMGIFWKRLRNGR